VLSRPTASSTASPAELLPVVSAKQTHGFRFAANAQDGYATSVDVIILNPLGEIVTLYDFVVSWEKLSMPSEPIASSGYPAGTELIDYFSVRIADAEGEQHGVRTWTFVLADAQGKHTEQRLARWKIEKKRHEYDSATYTRRNRASA
jgi:hypothetical protein